MKTSKTLFAAAACALACFAPSAAQAAGAVILNENFNHVDALGGWVQVNNSLPAGQAWFQGNPGVFGAQSGPSDSYIGANYLSATMGSGTIDNWLNISAVPEPSAYLMFGLGLAVLPLLRRKPRT